MIPASFIIDYVLPYLAWAFVSIILIAMFMNKRSLSAVPIWALLGVALLLAVVMTGIIGPWLGYHASQLVDWSR